MYNWIDNIELGMKILSRKLMTRLIGYSSKRRIKEYKIKLDTIFNNFDRYVFLSDKQNHKEKEVLRIITCKEDKLYAPCIQQLLWDHFKIHSEIVKYGDKLKVTLLKWKGRKDINIKSVKSYVISNLYHQFNLYRGSNPTIICRFIRELEKIVTDFGIFEPQKNMSVYLTIDAEAQLAYVDNKRRVSTNIFSAKNKSALLLSETIQNISESFNMPHTYFIPTELLDYDSKDPLGNLFCNIEKNIRAVRELPSRATIAFHGYQHNGYKKRWSTRGLTEEYIENEIRKSKFLLKKLGIKMLSVNRYPGLSRESFSLNVLEKNNFRIDTSDLITEPISGEFLAYCRYRLLRYEGERIRPTEVWEIPVIYADPYVTEFNAEKIKELITYLEKGRNYHNSEVALMFHDVIIGFLDDTNIVFNLNDSRVKRGGSRAALFYFASQLKKLVRDLKGARGVNVL